MKFNRSALSSINRSEKWGKIYVLAAAYTGARTVVKTLHEILKIQENLLRGLLGLDDAGFDDTRYRLNISLVVEFQKWWVLKSKLFAQESTY